MSEQAMTGPRRMRQWAAYIEQNIKNHLLPLAVKNPDTLRELAAQWDADRARAERAGAALEQARELLAELVACGYECQAGALENNTAYRELAALLAPAGGAE